MPRVRLQSIAVRFRTESKFVLLRFSHVFPKGHEECSTFHLWCQEMCVIRLLDAWSRFCRELVLKSASEQPLTVGGSRVPLAPGITGRRDVLKVLRTVYTKFPFEPRWIDAQACFRAASMLKIANYSTVSSGLAVSPSPVDDLRKLRNFLAHRHEGTAGEVHAAAANIGIAPTSDVIGILRSNSAGTGLNVLQTWIEQLQTMSEISAR